jgi:hypothetical protein
MKEFSDYILQFGELNKRQIELIIGKGTILELHKDEYFSEAGKIPTRVGFVLEGVFRFSYYNNKGDEITNYFIDEYSFVADCPKFEGNVVATEYI